MALTQLPATNISVHQSLADDPALTAAQLKAKWDLAAETIRTFINGTLIAEQDVINATIPTVTYGTAAASGGADGDIYLRYS